MKTRRHQVPGAVPWARVGAAALALLAGLALGLLVAAKSCGSQQGPGVSQERFAILAATVYAEGEPIAAVRDYLVALGTTDRSAFLLQLADRYNKSGDRLKQRQAEDLRRLGEDLRQAPANAQLPGSSAAIPSPTRAAAQGQTAIIPTPTVRPTTSMAAAKSDGVRLRREPRAKADTVKLLKNGERVEVLNVVDGEPVEGNEKRWYKVRNGLFEGYVYFTLLVPVD